MDHTEATTRLLDAAEALFYERGVQSVGMDDIRAATGVSLKRLYQCYPSKEHLVVGCLRRRDQRWCAALAESVAAGPADPAERILAVFGWLYDWFGEPGFRGCAFVNIFGELGGTTPAVAAVVREHKAALKRYLGGLVEHLGVTDADALTEQLQIVVEGAITVAAVTGDPSAAHHARATAQALLGIRPGTARVQGPGHGT